MNSRFSIHSLRTGAWRMALAGVILASVSVLALPVLLPVVAQAATTFRNPLNPDHGSDPWMQYYNGQYYLTATTWSSDPNVGITMKHASTIAGLIAATPTRIFYDTTSTRCCNIWAPEFHLLNGPNGLRWYLYYVAGVSTNTDSQRMYVAESAGTDPLGPYTYKGQLAAGGPTDAWAVDPTIMTINSQLYLFYSAYEGVHYSSSQNIYGVALSNPWTLSGSPALIARPTYAWETGTAAVNEGPVQLTAPNGTIYLVFSATWCGNPNYQLGRATYNGGPVLSQSSWVKFSSPIFSAANGQYSTAHNGFFKSPDGTEDWIVYHGTTSSGGACDNTRTTRIQKFTWNADNTPNLGAPLGLTTDINVPSGEGGTPAPTDTPTATNTPGPSPTPTNTATPTNTPLPPQTDPVVYYQFEGNANDSSGNGYNGTLVNGPTFVTGKVGQAVNLDGTNDHMSLPIGRLISTLNDFSVAAWVKLDTTGSWRRIFDFGTGTTVNMFLVPTNGSVTRFAITISGNCCEQQINSASALPTGVWKHMAVTKSGNTATLYVDGAQVGQNTAMTLNPSSLGNTTQNWIGRSQYADPYLDGQIDEFRIYNRALSASEVSSLFSGGPTPTPTSTATRTNTPTATATPTPTNTPSGPTNTPTPTWTPSSTPTPGDGPIHWYKFDGNAADSGSSPQNGTLVNGPTFVTGKVGQAVDLAGGAGGTASQHVSLPTGIVNGLTNFSIATWVKLDTTGNWRRIFDFGTGTAVNLFLAPTTGSTSRYAITTSGSNGEQRINSASALSTGVWHHVAVTLSGSTGTLYVDGAQVGQNTAMTLNPSSLGNTTNNWLGRSQYSNDRFLDGQIDEFRIYNRALSAAEVLSLFQNP